MRKSSAILFLLFSLNVVWAKPAHTRSFDCKEAWNDILNNVKIEKIYEPLIGLCGNAFERKLGDIISTNDYLEYYDARLIMFSDLDNKNGSVCGVYSDFCLDTVGIPHYNIMNCEHSWPQSMGATGIAKSDLHHLYPAEKGMNSRRKNHPFCEVYKATWVGSDSKLGYNKAHRTCFEPPKRHRGNVARAMLYFSVRYAKSIDSEQEYFFKKWNKDDPVDFEEIIRNEKILEYQNNSNPFIDHPEFVNLIQNY
jgi:hypothetical protein